MPNWCDNHMTIYGPADKIIDFVGGVEAMEIPSFLKKYAPLDPDNPEWWDYDIASEKWGTKWADCHLRMPSTSDTIQRTPDAHGNLDISVNFDTAWGPPLEGLLTVSQRWPTLVFGLTFHEQGMDFMGSIIYINGDPDVVMDDNIPRFIHPYMYKVDTIEEDPYETQHERFMEWLTWQYRFVRSLSVRTWQDALATKSEDVTTDV